MTSSQCPRIAYPPVGACQSCMPVGQHFQHMHSESTKRFTFADVQTAAFSFGAFFLRQAVGSISHLTIALDGRLRSFWEPRDLEYRDKIIRCRSIASCLGLSHEPGINRFPKADLCRCIVYPAPTASLRHDHVIACEISVIMLDIVHFHIAAEGDLDTTGIISKDTSATRREDREQCLHTRTIPTCRPTSYLLLTYPSVTTTIEPHRLGNCTKNSKVSKKVK